MPSPRSLFLIALLALALSACGEDKAPTPATGPAPPATPSTPGARIDSLDSAPRSAAPGRQQPPAPPAGASTTRMAPTPATVLRETELKDKPFVDAKTLQRLPAQTRVVIVDRSGGWLKVTRDGQAGWVRLLHVSSQASGGGGTARELESVAKMATGRAGSGNIVNTTGIRGLSEEQLRQAQPDPAEVKRLEGYGVDKKQAEEYAREHNLERRQVAELPPPR